MSTASIIADDEVRSAKTWARTCIDPAEFAREQDYLSKVWNFVGFTRDLAQVGDWITAKIGGREIFVQRMKDGLHGFENRCAHRHHPLKVGSNGNGPVVCGFHHWKYDADGLAVGIPNCLDLFGKLPKQLNRRLVQLDVATCGALVFARFRGGRYQESLEQSFAQAFPILAALVPEGVEMRSSERAIAANWKIFFEITLDDYHLAAVHPTTFGRVGYLKREDITYHRIGLHSAYFGFADPTSLEAMAAKCRRGEFKPKHYRIFQLFPNLMVVQLCVGAIKGIEFWQTAIQHMQPVSAGQTRIRSWSFASMQPPEATAIRRLARKALEPVIGALTRPLGRRVLEEDVAACEAIQSVIGQAENAPVFAATEERVAWFREAYADVVRP